MQHQYIFRVFDSLGAMVMGNGYGDYVDASCATEAREKAEAIFLSPDPEPSNEMEAKFLASISATRKRVIANGYSIEVRRKK